ncbi:hypothetical protein FNSP10_13270 [Fusobacterium nucleatum]|jgi:hypothetical protein|nr:hypothetical protein FNCP10_11050 [Fusobacterium nucleatum]BEP07953.1 hypothetical protein FNSP10_13270 [Fusobacterium nucleatum]
MHSRILLKYWYRIPFPSNITLMETVKIIKKYIEMEGENGNKGK